MMMKHRIFLLLLVLSLMCGLCACTAAPTDTGASAQTDELSDAQETTASSVSDGTETIIQFTDEAASVSGSGCEADGTALTVSESGVYRLSGSCADGSVTIKKGTTDVTLILDNLTLTSTDTAPITCGKSSQARSRRLLERSMRFPTANRTTATHTPRTRTQKTPFSNARTAPR